MHCGEPIVIIGLCFILTADVFNRALASYYITPFSAQLGSKVGTFAHQHIPTKEGSGVGWLRGWAKNLGLSRSNGDNSYQTQRTRV